MGSTTLKPGEETTVSLSMIMHPGMEGPHLFRVAVPLYGDGANAQPEVLDLFVRGLFGPDS